MKYRKLTSVILTAAMIMSIGTAAGAVPEEEDGIAGFVERAYSLILGRESDSDGKADWCGRLSSGDITAAEMIHGFVYSNEFQTADIDNEEKVEIMYSVMLDRTPDETGHEHWLSLLEDGAEMDDIIAGFCGSQEFLGICSDYGITAGTVAGTDYRTGMFIERCYQLVLGRGSDDQLPIISRADITVETFCVEPGTVNLRFFERRVPDLKFCILSYPFVTSRDGRLAHTSISPVL